MSFPQVFDNERVIPADFRAQTDAIEDAVGTIVRRMLSAAQNSKGIVVEGCKPSASFDPADPRRVRVEAGYALLPPSAGEAAWRLVHIPAVTYLHPDADPKPRTDCICVAMQRVDGPTFPREYRVVDAAGVESVDPNVPTATTYTVEGLPTLAKSAGAANTVGTVRLGTVTVNANGSVTVADLRDHAMPIPTYGDPAAPWDTVPATANENGRFWRTAGQAVTAISDALKKVATRNGALQRTLATADGGPAIGIATAGLDFVMNLGLRAFMARHIVATGNAPGQGDVVSTNGNVKAPLGKVIGQQLAFFENDASFDVDPTGRTLTPANIQRCTAQVDMNVDVNDVYVDGSARWIGQNIQSITRIEPGHWRIVFDLNQMPDNLNNRRWRLSVNHNRAVGAAGSYPSGMETGAILHQIGKGPTDDSIDVWFFAVGFAPQLTVVTDVQTSMTDWAVSEVTTTTANLNPLTMQSWDCPFSVHLYGPLPSGNWDWAPVQGA